MPRGIDPLEMTVADAVAQGPLHAGRGGLSRNVRHPTRQRYDLPANRSRPRKTLLKATVSGRTRNALDPRLSGQAEQGVVDVDSRSCTGCCGINDLIW